MDGVRFGKRNKCKYPVEWGERASTKYKKMFLGKKITTKKTRPNRRAKKYFRYNI